MPKFLVTRTVTQDIIVYGAEDKKQAADFVNDVLGAEDACDHNSKLAFVDETILTIEVDQITDSGPDLGKRVKQLQAGASEDRFTQLSDHEVQ